MNCIAMETPTIVFISIESNPFFLFAGFLLHKNKLHGWVSQNLLIMCARVAKLFNWWNIKHHVIIVEHCCFYLKRRRIGKCGVPCSICSFVVIRSQVKYMNVNIRNMNWCALGLLYNRTVENHFPWIPLALSLSLFLVIRTLDLISPI